MRITNKIMQKNSLTNINNNKILQDRLNTQMTTQKKNTRPSDDPVTAIRSLRLSTNVTKLTQYNDKNAKDAESWLSVTEDAISEAVDVILDIYHQCEKGAGDDMNTSNYKAIIEQLKSLRDETYSCGDADYAGRNLFTGYRTDSKLTFQENTSIDYSIKQTFSPADIDKQTNVHTGDILDYSAADGFTTVDTEVETQDYYRLRLAYDGLKEGTTPSLTYKNADGTTATVALTAKNSTDLDAFTPAADEAYFLADTGEIVLGSNVYSQLSALTSSTELSVTYEKSDWAKGDLRPEHYFDCSTTVGGVTTDYTAGSKQDISYDLGSNQSLQVNTHADEVFSHDIGRDVDDLEVLVSQLEAVDSVVSQLESKISNDGLTGTALTDAKNQLAAAEKAQTLLKDQVQKTFGSTMTTMQGYEDRADLAMTSVGTRGSRLTLIQNRLSSQKSTFKELLSENDNKDITETATELASAELAYNAALSATSKILQTSLMNYI